MMVLSYGAKKKTKKKVENKKTKSPTRKIRDQKRKINDPKKGKKEK